MTEENELRNIAKKLRNANGFSPIPAIHDEINGPEDAYKIQKINREIWVTEGRHETGFKVAFTTPEAKKIFGTNEPVYGSLFADMSFPTCHEIPPTKMARPKLEGEIVLELGKDLPAKKISNEKVISSVNAFYVALEIPDGSFIGEFNAVDMIADNAAAAGYVLGDRQLITHDTNLATLSMEMRQNSKLVSTGNSSACMGNPMNVLIWLQSALAKRNEGLKAGQIIYCGSLVPIIQAQPGDSFHAIVDGSGSASCSFTSTS